MTTSSFWSWNDCLDRHWIRYGRIFKHPRSLQFCRNSKMHLHNFARYRVVTSSVRVSVVTYFIISFTGDAHISGPFDAEKKFVEGLATKSRLIAQQNRRHSFSCRLFQRANITCYYCHGSSAGIYALGFAAEEHPCGKD